MYDFEILQQCDKRIKNNGPTIFKILKLQWKS